MRDAAVAHVKLQALTVMCSKRPCFKTQGRYLRGDLCIDPEGPYPDAETLWDGEV